VTTLLVAACASFSPTPDDLASELLTSNAPRREFRRISDDIALDRATIQIMRARAAAAGATLLAVIHVSRGVHPYAVFTFLERGSEIDMIETAVYWGRVDGKWRTVVTASELSGVVEAARQEFTCTPGMVKDRVFGAALITWDGSTQRTCEGPWLLEEGSTFAARLQPITDRAHQTYDAFPNAHLPGGSRAIFGNLAEWPTEDREERMVSWLTGASVALC
jgi:hypothetical protein